MYNTHLHANYHHVIPNDIYLGHRVCQAYELIQFIESTSSMDSNSWTILLGDLNLRETDLGFQLIRHLLKFNDSFYQRSNKVILRPIVRQSHLFLFHVTLQEICDPTVGNSGRTCDLLDNPYVKPHPHQGEGDRIDYILYRSPNGLCI